MKIITKLFYLLSVMIFAFEMASAESENPFGKRRGVLTGMVKHRDGHGKWLYVKDFKSGHKIKFYPVWKGGYPKHGGGFDKKVMAKIRTAYSPNIVQIKWRFNEHFRVLDLKVVKPKKSTGTVSGVVTEKGEHWVEIKPRRGFPERYSPRWIGGAPHDGGGPDREAIELIEKLRVGDKIKAKWYYDERMRIVDAKVSGGRETHEEKHEEEDEEEDEHEEKGSDLSKLVYEGKKSNKFSVDNQEEERERLLELKREIEKRLRELDD